MLRVTESPMCSPGVIALLGISSPSHLTGQYTMTNTEGKTKDRDKDKVKDILENHLT